MAEKFNPYHDLKRRFREFVNACVMRPRKTMWVYARSRLAEGWALDNLYERCAAAEQIGYEVQIKATDEGLVVQYVKKLPDRPYDV